MTNEELLQKGIDLAKQEDFQQASNALAKVVKADPLSEEGWLWLGRCRTNLQEKRQCFNQVVSINPNNDEAKQELLKLEAMSSNPDSSTLPDERAESGFTSAVLPATSRQPLTWKTFVRRTLYLLAGIVIGFNLAGYFFNSAPVFNYFAEVDRMIALKTLSIPDYHGPPALFVQAAPTVSLNDPYEKRLEQAWSVIQQADILSKSNRPSDAILLWNQALAQVPEYADGYYKRGASYYSLTGSQRVKSEYDYYIQLAISDFDTAINLNPNKGDYFLMRARAYADKAAQQTQRVDFQKLSQVAVENYTRGMELPQQETWDDQTPAMYDEMVNAGDCKTVIPKAQDLLDKQSEPSPKLESTLAGAYYCTGDLENALKHINEAYRLSPLSVCLCERAEILYDLGKSEAAMTDIEKSLDSNPNYGGYRFYTRALFFADQGNMEQAQKDLDFGMTQTWGRGGLLSYVQGKIALSQGKKQDAIYYFQDAEATYQYEGPLLDKIRQDLQDIGGAPREALAYPFLMTPIPFTPVPTLSVSPTSTSTAIP